MTSHGRSHRMRKKRDALRQAFTEFLRVPTSIIAGFLLLAAGTFVLDRGDADWLLPLGSLLQAYAFTDAAVTRDLLANFSQGVPA